MISATDTHFSMDSEAAKIISEPTIGFLIPRTQIVNPVLPGNVREVIKGMFSVLEEIVQEALSARTQEEFVEKRIDCFRKYAPIAISLSRFARIVIDPGKAELICTQVLDKTEEEFTQRGPAAFGEAATRQVQFTIWIFAKVNALVSRIAAHPEVSDDLRVKDCETANKFLASGLWSAFSLDCLTKALNSDLSIHPDIVDEHIEGLRSAVNAYAHAREAYAMRFPRTIAISEIHREWDDEDEALMSVPPEPIPADL